MLASPALKFERWITEDQFSNDYGLPGVALFLSAALGLVWLGVSALGIFTSVELRTNLAAAPMFVCLAAYALWQLSQRSTFGRVVAATGIAAIAWDGLRVWLYWLGRL